MKTGGGKLIRESENASVDSLAKEEGSENPFSLAIIAELRTLTDDLRGHKEASQRELGGFKNIQSGILIVVAIGFAALVISVIIFFVETIGRYESELSARSDKNMEFEMRNIQIEADSLRSRIGRLELRQYIPSKVKTLQNLQEENAQDAEP